MRHAFRLVWLALVLLNVSGCGLSIVAEPKTNPVLEDRVGRARRQPIATLATTAERRVVLVDIREGSAGFGRFCAEPPPDA